MRVGHRFALMSCQLFLFRGLFVFLFLAGLRNEMANAQGNPEPDGFEIIAVEDEPAPGFAEEDPQFRNFKGFASPVISSSGTVGFRASVGIGAASFADDGIWTSDNGGSLMLRIRRSDKFQIDFPSVPDPVERTIGGIGRFAFDPQGYVYAVCPTLSVGSECLVLQSKAGRGATVFFNDDNSFGNSFDFTPDGVAFGSQPKMLARSTGERFFSVSDSGDPTTIFNIGDDETPGGGSSTFALFSRPVLSSLGDGAFQAFFSDTGQAIYNLETSGATTKIACTGEMVPDLDGASQVVLNGLLRESGSPFRPVAPALDGLGRVSFLGFVGASFESAIFQESSEFGLVMVVRQGIPVTTFTDGIQGQTTFSSVEHPVATVQGDLFFRGLNQNFDQEIWRYSERRLELVIAANTVAPGLSGKRITGFIHFVVNRDGRVAFLAGTDDGNFGSPSRGLWVQNGDGDFVLIAQEGSSLDQSTAPVELFGLIIDEIDIAYIDEVAVASSDGRSHAFGDTGDFVFKAIFDDGKERIIRAIVDQVEPEAQGTAYTWKGAAGTDNWHTIANEKSNWVDASEIVWKKAPGILGSEEVTIEDAVVVLDAESANVASVTVGDGITETGKLIVSAALTLEEASHFEQLDMRGDITAKKEITLEDGVWRSGSFLGSGPIRIIESDTFERFTIQSLAPHVIQPQLIIDKKATLTVDGLLQPTENQIENNGTIVQEKGSSIDLEQSGGYVILEGEHRFEGAASVTGVTSQVVSDFDMENLGGIVEVETMDGERVTISSRLNLASRNGKKSQLNVFRGIAAFEQSVEATDTDVFVAKGAGLEFNREAPFTIRDGVQNFDFTMQVNGNAQIDTLRLKEQETVKAVAEIGANGELVLDRLFRGSEQLFEVFNNGSLKLQGVADSSLPISDVSLIVNRGTLSKQGTRSWKVELIRNFSSIEVNGGKLSVDDELVNTGLIEIESGTLEVVGFDPDSTSSVKVRQAGIFETLRDDNAILISGSMQIDPGGEWSIFGVDGAFLDAQSFVQNNGVINGDVRIIGGVESLGTLSGNGVVNGNIINQGRVVPGQTSEQSQPVVNVSNQNGQSILGFENDRDRFRILAATPPLANPSAGGPSISSDPASSGSLTINGDYTQLEGGFLELGLGGSNPDDYDQLIVNGTANLDGVLKIDFLEGMAPIDGALYNPLVANSFSGAFDKVIADVSSSRIQFDVVVDNGGVKATASVQEFATFVAWQSAVFTADQLADDSISGPQADPDQDSMMNLLEYALDGNPLLADIDGLVSVEFEHEADGDFLIAEFPWANGMIDIGYRLQTSSDLANWSDTPSEEIASQDLGVVKNVTLKANLPAGDAQFARLVVSAN